LHKFVKQLKQVEQLKQEPQESQYAEEEIPTEAASTSGMPWSTPKITLRQTEPNCWQVILNKEEQETTLLIVV